MDKIKKILCILLVCLITILPCSVLGNVSAQTDDTEPLKVEVTTDKTSYKTYGIAEITVNVTNTSDETVNNISAEAVFNDLSPVGKNNETSKEVESLKSGESFSFSYKATVNASKIKLNFFEKIILWFVRLFNGGYSVTGNNFDDGRENISKTDLINFGRISAENTIKILYGIADYDIDNVIELSTNVSTEISEFRKTDVYKNATIEEKVTLMGDFLHSLQDNGKIKNVTYNSNSYVYKYELYNGWKYGIVINNQHTNCWSASEAINQRELVLNSYNNKNFNTQSASTKNRWEFLFDDIPSNDNMSYKNMHNLFEFYSDNLNLDDTSVGFSTGLTVDAYKNLSENKLYYIMSHGNFDGETPLIITQEKVTEQKQRDYSLDYDRGDIEVWDFGDEHREDLRFIIRPSIFENNYKSNELNGSVFFLSCCRAFGMDNKENYAFSESLRKAGASVVIGFCNSVNEVYSAVFYEKMLQLLSTGITIYEAYNTAKNLIGHNQNIFVKNISNENPNETFPAYPIFSGERNTKLFDNSFNGFGSCTISIKDNLNEKPIKDIRAFAISDLETLGFTSIAKSEDNGVLTIIAPAGKYYCDLIHNNYDIKQIEINIEKGVDTVLSEPVTLTRKTGEVAFTFKDIKTEQAISNVIVEVIDNESESSDPIATTNTDENGFFSLTLPYGNYTLSFSHDNYCNQSISLYVDAKVILINDYFLNPIDSSEENEDTESTPTISGSCGENVYWDYFEETQTLSIYGSGNMQDYNSAIDYPWSSYKDKISTITIGENITSIGKYAFYNTDIVDITIPKNITVIGDGAFSHCDLLETIHLKEGLKNLGNSLSDGVGCFYMCTKLNEITLPNTINMIGFETFYGCTSLQNIELPNSITVIGMYAFYNCKSLTSITIPNKVTTIGNYTFCGCTSLKSVTIPNSVTAIWMYAFYNCKSLTSITISDNVTVIDCGAFSNCASLTSITIPNGVTTICRSAFSNCKSLTNITIPNSVTGIGSYAFYNCTNLASINVDTNNPSYASINGILFNKNKTELIQYPIGNTRTNYTIPNSVTLICEVAFSDCKNLTSITISDSVTTISRGAFNRCTSLTSVTIPNNVKEIEMFAFNKCTSLTSITISNSVSTINDNVFFDCTSLTSVTIPNSVKEISHSAFKNCKNLTDVYYSGKEEEWNNIYIENYNTYLTNATIHYNS